MIQRSFFCCFLSCVIRAFTFILISGLSAGCSSDNTKEAEVTKTEQFNEEYNRLFAPYMSGDIQQARQGLENTILYIKGSDALDQYAQSGYLYMEYARLYALDKRTGNRAAVADDIIKARYWIIRNLRPPESLDDNIISYVMTDSPEKMINYVEVLDAGDNGDRPKYVRYITNSP